MIFRGHLLTSALIFLCLLPCAIAQNPESKEKLRFAGDYAGFSKPFHVKLHIVAANDGTLSGTVDSPDQGLTGLPCANIHTDGQAINFTVPMVHGTWTGLLSADGSSLSGTWSQGNPTPLNFTRLGTAISVTGNADTPLAPASGGSVPEPEYVNSFYGLGDDGKLIELDRDRALQEALV
jgi:hypothetical protein